MFNPEVANSNGFFKDPVTKQDLTGNEPRVVKCEIDDHGKLIWPQVKFSDGSCGKIVYKLWTQEEKQLYKIYREGSKARTHSQVKEETQEEEAKEEHPVIVREKCYIPDTAAQSTLDYIKACDKSYGVWLFDSITYDLLGSSKSHSYVPIPRSLIPAADRLRLRIP